MNARPFSFGPINNWVLKNAQDIVQRLHREQELLMPLGSSERLSMEGIKLLVPEGILVYHLLKKVEEGPDAEFFFTVREGDDIGHAYLSQVRNRYSKESIQKKIWHPKENIALLLNCPWYNNGDSSKIFHRIVERRYIIIDSRLAKRIKSYNHPFDRGEDITKQFENKNQDEDIPF